MTGLATIFKMGTASSGNRGHRGRPGKIGGSLPKGAAALHIETLPNNKGDVYLYHLGHNPMSDELKSQWLKQISEWPRTTDREDARRWIASDAVRTSGDTASIAVALKGNELMGAISYRGANTWDDMKATSVYVYDLASKQRGYGTSLIMNAVRDADRNKVELKLYALKDAVPFYLGLGFKREMDRSGRMDYDECSLYLDTAQAKKLVKMSTKKTKALSEWEQFLALMEKLEPEDGAFTMPKKVLRPKQLLPIFEVKMGTAASGNWGHTSTTRDAQDARGGSDPNPQAASKRKGERANLVVTEAERKKHREDDARTAEKLGLKSAIRKKDGTLVYKDGTKVPKNLLENLTSGIPPGLEDIYVNPSKKSIMAGDYAVRGRSVTTGALTRIYNKDAKAEKKDKYWVKVGQLEQHEGLISRRIERESNGAKFLDLEENSCCLRLIQHSAIRAGGEDEVKFGVYGATTLLGKHVTIKGSKAVLDFIGKESVRNVITVTDTWLVKELKQRKANAGNNGKLFETTYNGKYGLLAYTKSLHKNQYTPKMFRSLRATQWAYEEMQKIHKMPTTKKEYAALIKQVSAPVGVKLGHTSKKGEPWSMAYNNYIDPRLFADWKKSAGV